jgi:reactive intermediate/imine deaminase
MSAWARLATISLICFSSVSSLTAAERKVIATARGADLGLPYSPGILAGDFLYLAGALGLEPGTTTVSGDVKSQTRRTLDNLGELLKIAGMDFSHAVSVNVYLKDARLFEGMNEVYRTYFPKDPPARATIEANLALPDALVEISMVAARPGVSRQSITPEGWRQPALPYSWGILAGDTLFVSGITSRNPKTLDPVPGDMGAQTRQVLENIGGILKAAGMDYRNIAASRVFINDSRQFQPMNDAYRSFFPEAPPARATVEAPLMNPAFRAEIQCVAVKGERKVVVAAGAPRSQSPLSPAIQVGDRLFLSGMLGRGPQGFAPGDVKAQTRQTLENLRATLQAAGMDFSQVAETTVFLTDLRSFGSMNEVYRELLPTAPPARATVGVPLMAPEALVEIMMTAVK